MEQIQSPGLKIGHMHPTHHLHCCKRNLAATATTRSHPKGDLFCSGLFLLVCASFCLPAYSPIHTRSCTDVSCLSRYPQPSGASVLAFTSRFPVNTQFVLALFAWQVRVPFKCPEIIFLVSVSLLHTWRRKRPRYLDETGKNFTHSDSSC